MDDGLVQYDEAYELLSPDKNDVAGDAISGVNNELDRGRFETEVAKKSSLLLIYSSGS